ncbi:hypothetical protein CPC08DRAFT_644758, partial [Agrocybe pediades]
VPSARKDKVPPALYMRVVKRLGGIPLSNTCDMGTEVRRLIPMVTALRAIEQPALAKVEHILPTFRAVKSVYNVTRERGWRSIYEKDLSNVLYEYQRRKLAVGYCEEDKRHKGVALWLWGQIVQERLNRLMKDKRNHYVRKQKDRLLPTGGRIGDFFDSPEKWGGKDKLIVLPAEKIDAYLEKYDKPKYTRFGSKKMVATCEWLYASIGSPALLAKHGWDIFAAMVNLWNESDMSDGEDSDGEDSDQDSDEKYSDGEYSVEDIGQYSDGELNDGEALAGSDDE